MEEERKKKFLSSGTNEALEKAARDKAKFLAEMEAKAAAKAAKVMIASHLQHRRCDHRDDSHRAMLCCGNFNQRNP
eukprot:8006075-Pyramimonas_sp.AAC.1